jgi:hypothetical protein
MLLTMLGHDCRFVMTGSEAWIEAVAFQPNLNAVLPPYLASLGGGSKLRELSGYVLVAQHDQVLLYGRQVLYGHSFGFSDRARQRVPTADTSFRIGSVTKQFTAAAILRLEQDGKFASPTK